jgi:hypothetical protein
MPIPVSCQHCDWKGRVRDDLSGKKGKCPTCGELIDVPKASAVKAAAPKPAPKPKAVAEDDEEKPKPKAKRSLDDVLSSARGRDVDDEDDRPAKSRRRPADDDEDEDDRPAKSRRRPADDDEDEDDRPRPKSRRRPVDDEEDEDDDQPRTKSRRADYDEDDEPRPRRKKKKRRAGDYGEDEGGGVSQRTVSIGCGVMFILLGLGLFAFGIIAGGRGIWGLGPLIIGVLTLLQAFRSEE